MAITTCDGLTVLEARVHLPLTGVWHAEVFLDSESVIETLGRATLSLTDGALVLVGTVRRADVWRGRVRASLVGGAHGLIKTVSARSYLLVPARTIVTGILDDCGEKLAASSDSTILGAVLPAWTRAGVSGGVTLAAIVDALGANWRMLPSGEVWIGVETWPASTMTDYVLIERRPEDASLLVAPERPTLLPGTMFEGGLVGRVVHHITPERTRTEVYFDAP